MTRNCNGRSDVAACLKKSDNKEYVLGKYLHLNFLNILICCFVCILGTQHQLNYRNGEMYFSFSNGENCKKDENYQLHVILGCDYTLDKDQSRVTSYVSKICIFC